jgi:hypothetical protein
MEKRFFSPATSSISDFPLGWFHILRPTLLTGAASNDDERPVYERSIRQRPGKEERGRCGGRRQCAV